MFNRREQNARHQRSGTGHWRRPVLAFGFCAGFLGFLFLTVSSETSIQSTFAALSEFHLLASPAVARERHNAGGDNGGDDGGQQQGIHQEQQDQQEQHNSDHQNFQPENSDNGSNSEVGSWETTNRMAREAESDGSGHPGRSGAAGNRDIDDKSKPPKTVESLLKRLFEKKDNAKERPNQDSLNRNAANKTHKTPGIRQTAEEFEEVVGQEILAVNASPGAVARAQALGFKTVPATNLSKLAISVTRLVPPPGMDVMTAKEILSQDLPAESFGINQKYRIYKTATGTTPDQLNASAAARDAGHLPCDADHCFGRNLIGWKGSPETCAVHARIGIIDTAVDLAHPAFSHKKLELRHLGPDGTPVRGTAPASLRFWQAIP